jgi:hypothetical protein
MVSLQLLRGLPRDLSLFCKEMCLLKELATQFKEFIGHGTQATGSHPAFMPFTLSLSLILTWLCK